MNPGLVHVEEITAVLAYKKVHLMDAVSTCALNEDKTGRRSLKVKVMIFCTALSREKTGACITTTWNLKAIHLYVVTPLLPERKNTKLNVPLENAFTQFSGTTKASFTRCTWSKVQE